MAIFSSRELKQEALRRLSDSPVNTKKLVLIHTGVLTLLALGSSGLNLFLDNQIGTTGGLDGMGLRSVLQTVQEILSYVNLLFGPFWSAGFLWAMMVTVRGQDAGPRDLLSGFRKFGRILGYVATDLMIGILVLLACTNAASVVFSLSPWGAEFMDALGPVLEDPNLITAEGILNVDLVPMEALSNAVLPIMVIFMVFFLPLYAWISYRFRMALYLIMDNQHMSGVRAFATSARLMRGHKLQLLKLDLSFWWYYALAMVAGVAGYLDLILPALGLELPLDPTVMFFITLLLYNGLLLALHLWKKPQVDAAYILAYDAIAYPAEAEQ